MWMQLKKEWKEGDTMLLDLMPFLEAIVRTHVRGPGRSGVIGNLQQPTAATVINPSTQLPMQQPQPAAAGV